MGFHIFLRRMLYVFFPDVVAFDNRNSWVHSKELSYSVEVMKPGMHIDQMNNDITITANGDVQTVTEIMEATTL